MKDGEYQAPENLGEPLNTAGAEVQPAISPDESTLVFTTFGRDDEIVGVHREYNKGDLYVSFQHDGQWTAPRNCGPGINSGAGEAWPAFSSDGRSLFFSSERGFATYRVPKRLTWRELERGLTSVLNGMGNIYQAPAETVPLNRDREGALPRSCGYRKCPHGTTIPLDDRRPPPSLEVQRRRIWLDHCQISPPFAAIFFRRSWKR